MKVLLAVSGGIDSMTMADRCVCHKFPFLKDASFGVAHCNFHLRGDDSDADASFVAGWSEAHGLPFFRADFDTQAYCREHAVSIETGARELRYKWFGEICRRHGYDCVAVAHNANDNAETLLLNLLRGSGIRGICGMSVEDVLPYSDGSLKLLRPMLGCTRAEIEAWAREGCVTFRTDKTNFDSDYKRNYIRNEVFPLLEKLNPSLVRTLNSDMTNFSAASRVISAWTGENERKVTGSDGNIQMVKLVGICNWEYLLYEILYAKGFNPSVISDVQRLVHEAFVKKTGITFSGKCFEGDGIRLVTSSDELMFCPPDVPDSQEEESVCLEDGEWRLGNDAFDVKLGEYQGRMNLKCPAGVVMLDAGKVAENLVIRRWREGDWMRPLGLKGKKKLSDLFTDLHLDKYRKEHAVVLASSYDNSGHVYAVLGLRIDDSVKITPDSGRLVTIMMK